ncbi:MAG: hypothetical protein WBQ89_22645 [Candidatus Acidiferrum sp.]
MSKKKTKKPFKIIPNAPALRDNLGQLTGDELKVWMYLWLRTAEEGTAYPGNETMSRELDIYLAGIKKAKKGLRAKGWLSSNGQRVRADGTFSTVLESVHQPWVEKQPSRGSDSDPAVVRKTAHGTVGRNTDDGKTTQHKEYSVNPEGTPSAYTGENLEGHSESASELVSVPTNSKAEVVLTQEANTVLNSIYPRAVPSGLEPYLIKRLETFLANNPVDWKDYFEWHKTHKPETLRWRTLEKFLEGIEYSLNDLWGHDANTCRVCNPKRKASATAETSEPQGATEPTIFGAPVPAACGFHREELIAASRLAGPSAPDAVNKVMKHIYNCTKCGKVAEGDLSHIGYCLGCGESAHGGTMREDGLCVECFKKGAQPAEPGSMEAQIAANQAKAAAAGFDEEEA